MKKALKFSMVMLLILLAGVFLVTSCSNPSDGRDGLTIPGGIGPGGADGITWSDTTLSAEQLEALFAESNKVTVIPVTGSITLEGKVPQGKTLVINASALTGNSVDIDSDGFEVEGTLEIKKDGRLYADGVSSGFLFVKGGTLTGPGLVYLPIIVDERVEDFDALDYASSSLEGKVAYSVAAYTGGSPNYTVSSLVDRSDIESIFRDGIADELAVSDIATAIRSITIPEGKTLTLWGDNDVVGVAGKFEPEGAVIVKGKLSTTSAAIEIHPLGSIAIEKDGLLDLADAGDKITTGRGTVTNAGTIATITGSGDVLQPMLALEGIGDTIGTIETSASATLTLTASVIPPFAAGDPVKLTQNLKIIDGIITAPAVTGNTLFTVTGTPVITVAGTSPTPAFSIPTLNLAGKALGAGIAIETLEEDPYGVTLYGKVTTNVLASSELKKVLDVVDGNVESTGALVLDGDLEIPEIVTLDATAGTFTPAAPQTYTVTVKGTANFPAAATFGNGTAIKVDGDADFAGAFVALTGNVTVDGTADFPALGTATAGTIQINGEADFAGSVAIPVTIAGSATFGAGTITNLTVNSGALASTGAVTILTLSNNGTLYVNGDLTLGAPTTTIAGGVVYVTGDLTPGAAINATGAELYVYGTLVLGTGSNNLTAGLLSLDRAAGTDASGTATVTASSLRLGAVPNLPQYGYSGEAGLTVTLASTITGVNLQTALAALKGDLAKLVGVSLVNYSTAPSITLPEGAGGITIAGTSAAGAILTTGTVSLATLDATSGDIAAVALGAPSYAKYSSSGFPTSGLSWLFDTNVLKIADTGFAGPADLKAIFTIPGVALKSGDVSLTTPDFNVGILTGR